MFFPLKTLEVIYKVRIYVLNGECRMANYEWYTFRCMALRTSLPVPPPQPAVMPVSITADISVTL